MPYLSGADRRERQLLPDCVEDYVEAENEVRVIEAFVERLDEAALAFGRAEAATGRPAYAPRDLLKLWLWGYLNRVTSSRRLERECRRNLEVIWLLRRLRPDHWTICAFRRGAEKTLRALLREFGRFARELELITGELVAIDGTKLKAVNHVGRQLTAAQLAREEEQLQQQIDTFLRGSEEADKAEGSLPPSPSVSAPSATEPEAEATPALKLVADISAAPGTTGGASEPERQTPPALTKETLPQAQARLAQCRARQESLRQSGRETLTLTDPDSRRLRKVGVGYNGQIAVDGKAHLILAAEIVDAGSDYGQLLFMGQAARTALELPLGQVLKVTADGGFYNRQLLYAAEMAGLETYVPRPKQQNGAEDEETTEAVGTGAYAKSAFAYDPNRDLYTCPRGETLPRVRTAHKRGLELHYYANPAACASCPVRARCSKGAAREVERWVHENVLEQIEARRLAAPEMAVRRKALVEHPFGTIKFWNYQGAFLTRGFAGVRAEFLFSALAYNLKRLLRLVPLPELLQRLRARPEAPLEPTPTGPAGALAQAATSANLALSGVCRFVAALLRAWLCKHHCPALLLA